MIGIIGFLLTLASGYCLGRGLEFPGAVFAILGIWHLLDEYSTLEAVAKQWKTKFENCEEERTKK